VLVVDPGQLDYSDAWIEGDATARWRSAAATTADGGTRASGSSILEVDAGCRLPRHTDSAEETVIVLAGTAEIEVGGETATLPTGGLALVPEDVPHAVRNAGSETLRFLAMYAGTDVVTTYEAEVAPDGARERRPLG
jgi:quercetin dioxygenase-like cupin family protein